MSHIAHWLQFHCIFSHCQSPILNKHTGVVAYCDNVLKWVHWVNACIGIAMRWVTMRKHHLSFLLPTRKSNSLCTDYTYHSKSPDICGYWQFIACSSCLLSYNLMLSLELGSCSRQCFPYWKLDKLRLPVDFSHVQISRQDPSYPSFQVLWCMPGLTRTQQKLDPRFWAWWWIVLAVSTGDTHSALHNTSLGVMVRLPSHFVEPLCTSFGFQCIDISQICVHLLNPELEPWWHGN